jgi:hypothetical protein
MCIHIEIVLYVHSYRNIAVCAFISKYCCMCDSFFSLSHTCHKIAIGSLFLCFTQSALHLGWLGIKERYPNLPFKVRHVGKIQYEMQTSANRKIASLWFLPANSNAKHFIYARRPDTSCVLRLKNIARLKLFV